MSTKNNTAATDNNDPVEKHREASREYHRRMRALPPAKREASKIDNVITRLGKFVDEFSSWRDLPAEIPDAIKEAVEALKESRDSLNKLPEDYQPIEKRSRRSGGGGKSAFAVGCVCRVKPKLLGEGEKYEDIADDAESTTNLKLVKITDGGKLIVKTRNGDGAKLRFGKTDLEVVTPAE